MKNIKKEYDNLIRYDYIIQRIDTIHNLLIDLNEKEKHNNRHYLILDIFLMISSIFLVCALLNFANII